MISKPYQKSLLNLIGILEEDRNSQISYLEAFINKKRTIQIYYCEALKLQE